MVLILKQETSVQAGFLFGGIASLATMPFLWWQWKLLTLLALHGLLMKLFGGQFVVRGRNLFIF